MCSSSDAASVSGNLTHCFITTSQSFWSYRFIVVASTEMGSLQSNDTVFQTPESGMWRSYCTLYLSGKLCRPHIHVAKHTILEWWVLLRKLSPGMYGGAPCGRFSTLEAVLCQANFGDSICAYSYDIKGDFFSDEKNDKNGDVVNIIWSCHNVYIWLQTMRRKWTGFRKLWGLNKCIPLPISQCSNC